MIQLPVSFMTNRKDLFRQDQCAVCHGFFYEDELEHGDKERPLCHHCYINSFITKKGLVSRLNVELPMGMHLFEMLAVIAVIGLLIGIVVPNIVKLRTDAENRNLMNLYYAQQDTKVSTVAEQIMTSLEEGQELQAIAEEMPQLSDISDEELQQLETELCGLVGMDTEELKLAKAMRAIMELESYNDELDQFD